LAQSMLLAALVGILAGIVVPVLFLVAMRNRRRAQFAAQLPEALDVLVRSLKAGHPIPVAVSLVARDMPDPIGTEFGMTSDEMIYGLDLETALQNMRVRVGQDDLSFVVVAVSVQSKTGGNLSEVLANLSRVIRDRFKLRRRVKAMSAEGRLSAIALSTIPILVFFMVNLMAPTFYGDVKADPIIIPVIVATLLLWATGVFIIYRLVNFKY
jgi:tight adherence protein B